MSNTKASIALFLSKLSSGLVSLLALAILSRTLSLSEYGVFRQWNTVYSFLSVFLAFGLPSSINYFLPRAENQKSHADWITNILTVLIVTCGFFFLLTPIINVAIFQVFENDLISKYKFILAAGVMLSVLSQVFPNYFLVKKLGKALVIYTLLPNIIWLSVVLFLVFFNGTVVHFALSLLIKPIIDMVIGLKYAKISYNISDIKIDSVKKIFKFSIPIGLSSLVGSIMVYTDKFVVGSMLSVDQFALFSNGAHEIPFIGLITSSVFAVITPRLVSLYAEGSLQKMKEMWLRAGKVLVPIMTSISVILVFFGKTVMTVLYSEKFLDALPVFWMYQSLGIIRIYIYSSMFIASGKTRLYLINTIISAIINLGLDIVFVKLFGAVGASLATVLATFFLVGLQTIQIKRFTSSKKISEIFPVGSVILAVLLGASMSFFISWMTYRFSSNLIIEIFSATLTFLLVFIVLSICVSNEVMQTVLSRLVSLFRKVSRMV